MLHRSFKPATCKTALKLAMSRVKLMKNKKENHLKQLKRELAQLLESGQDQTAKIRVEHVIREVKMIAAYDLIDIYCELIVARLPIIESQKNCPIDLKEAVTSVIFAAPRCADIPELQDVRKHFTAKYGKEFINAALELRPECGISRMLVEKLSANAPDGQTKLKILTTIAEEHNVKWDPKSFAEKESKPYDDLLRGPNTLDKASKMQWEPPIVQAPPPPNVHPPQGRDQKHDEPANYQQNLHSSSSQNLASSDFSGGQSAPSTASRPSLRHLEIEYERTETRYSHSRDESAFSLGRQNWNMEFKDATAAAQAAAESAERASMAARAAAELSAREKITSQYSNKLHKSDVDGLRDDRPRKNNDSPSEKLGKDAGHSSSHGKNQMPSMRTEEVDDYVHDSHHDAVERLYKNDQNSGKRFSQSASSRTGTASVSVNDKRPVNDYHEVDRYSRKNSFEQGVLKPESTSSLSGTRVNKQSSGEDHNNYSRSSSSNNGDDYLKSRSPQNFVFNDNNDPFDHGKTCREMLKSGNVGIAEAVFDSNFLDDIIKFDKQTQYNEQEANFFSASISRESSNHFAVNIDKGSSWENRSGSSKKPLSASRVSAELFSPPQFDESSPKTPSSAHPEDLASVTFDDSSCPSSNSDGELENSSFPMKFDYDEITNRLSPQSSRLSSVNEVKNTDDLCHSVSTSRLKNEVSDQSRFGSDEEFKLSMLTGGIRNKGYKAYRKSPSGDSLCSKETAEDSPTYNRNAPASPVVGSSSLSSRVGSKVKEDSSSRTRLKKYDFGMDDFTEEPPNYDFREHMKENSSSRTQIKNYDLGTDDFEEEPAKSKLSNKQERKEDFTKSKLSAPAGYFEPDDNDSNEDLPKCPSTIKVHAESGFSHGTKANPDSETSFHSRTKHGSLASVSYVSESRIKSRPQYGKHPTTRPTPEEKHKPSAMEQPSTPVKTATSSGTETSRTSSAAPPSRESSSKKASHVHPKLPDYDTLAAHFQSLKQNRG